MGGNEKIVQLLIDAGADVNAWGRDYRPLHLAAQEGHIKAASLLISAGARINELARKDRTPLHMAIMDNHYGMAKFLIEQGALVENIPGDHPLPLQYAAKLENVSISKLIMAHQKKSSENQIKNSIAETEVDKTPQDFIEIINKWTELVSSKFKYSKSGDIFKINRDKLGSYLPPNENTYDLIDSLMKDCKFVTAFKVMLENQTADCFNQALLLGFILTNIPGFTEKYNVDIASLVSEEQIQHSFLIIEPSCTTENSFLYQQNPKEFIKKQVFGYYSMDGNTLLNSQNNIIADPWRNMVYCNVTDKKHPLDFVATSDIKKVKITVEGLRNCFLAAQSEFKELVNYYSLDSVLSKLAGNKQSSSVFFKQAGNNVTTAAFSLNRPSA